NKIKAMQEWPVPSNVNQLRGFLGLTDNDIKGVLLRLQYIGWMGKIKTKSLREQLMLNLMLCVYPNIGVQLMNVKGQSIDGVLDPELNEVVDTFEDTYRHPPMRKDTIEVMVKELLDSGALMNETLFPIRKIKETTPKCVFGTSHVEYLGHVISAKGVATDPNKIKAMQEWPVPSNVKQLRGFLGLTGYYRRFIMNFATVSRPLTRLLKKGGYKWTEEAQLAFETLKIAMMKASVLALPDFTKPFEVETDALGKHQSLSTYEKEFLAVLLALDKWRGYLLERHFIIKTCHFSLKYLLDPRITTPTQMKWLPKLMRFDYEVVYMKGSDNGAADALSRVQTPKLFSMLTTLVNTELAKKIEDSWIEDEKLHAIITKLQARQTAKKHYVWSNNRLTRKGKTVVGQNQQLRNELLQYYHGGTVGGHLGVKVTTYKICVSLY
ncbi:transposon ty3-G gag-pol polyprotein, partial [Tanacetum coccineum]